jgi:6-pyruvoyltetrahydropterin/6-carboxytetrahydropterin synthase
VWVSGEIDPETGYLIDLKILKTIIQKEIINRFDHRNLNLDCPEFEQLNPTAENIAAVIYRLMRQAMDKKYELSITLWETENNIVYFDGK